MTTARRYQTICVVLAALLFIGASSVRADVMNGWAALHELRLDDARKEFEKQSKKPAEENLRLRGLLLCDYFDLHQEAMIERMEALVAADPANPHLLGVFELAAAELEGMNRQWEIEKLTTDALDQHGAGRLSFLGRIAKIGQFNFVLEPPTAGWLRQQGLAPGAWVSGPYENQSEIAAYRPVPFEHESLDTLASTRGKLGVKVGWSWTDVDQHGTLVPAAATESVGEMAVQVRTFFSLPEAQLTNVLFGGAYRCRIIIDGVEVYNDKQYRIAHLREGIQAKLAAGPHEIRIVLTDEGSALLQMRIMILDENYETIDGLTWPRYASISKQAPENVRVIHPTFDAFDDHLAATGSAPDARFWRTYLQYQNGYQVEAIRSLEAAARVDSLSLLERWNLYRLLERNQEETHSIEHLGIIKARASTPLSDFTWLTSTSENFEQQARNWAALSDTYPGRLPLELSHALLRLLQVDKQGFVDSCNALKGRYPETSQVSDFLESIYREAFKEPEAAYREKMEYCDKTGDEFQRALYLRDYHLDLGNYDSAIFYSWKLARGSATHPSVWQQLVAVYSLARRSEELIPYLDSLIQRYPYNIDAYANLHSLYNNIGDYEKAKQALRALHEKKPTATMPYSILEELRNGATVDSIFGSVDVMSLWKDAPTPEQMGNEKIWYLCDIRQTLLYTSGVKQIDVHWAAVVTDQQSVETMQEVYVGLDTSAWSNRLLTARRLRKGQPPHSGVYQNQSVIFQDLQPGDAIEIRYRYWAGNYGDLWSEFWDAYLANSAYYQQQWKYVLITDRDDIKFVADSLFPDPVQDTHCGFTRWTWGDTNVAAMDFDQTLLPPSNDISGRLVISTIDSWEPLRRWYSSVSEAILGDNVRTDELTDKLVEKNWPDRKKLETLYAYVVLSIPYQTIDFNYHGAIPHTPDDVLVNQWGDCKDKGHLLIQMLRHTGIEAWPVLVATRINGSTMPLPAFTFDHLIVQCVIDGERVFVDPTSELNPPLNSILGYIAGQPCLVIDTSETTTAGRLPHFLPGSNHWTYEMDIEPGSDGEYRYEYRRSYFNTAAGEARSNRRGKTITERRKDYQTNITDSWGLTVQVDSLWCDSILTIDSVFNETLTGKISLPTQHIGSTTIVSMPEWSLMSRSQLARLMVGEERAVPVDLYRWAGQVERSFRLTVPPEWGTPQLSDPVAVTDPSFRFEAIPDFDPDSRVLHYVYRMTIEDALVEPAQFMTFVKQVVAEFEKPLIFTAP